MQICHDRLLISQPLFPAGGQRYLSSPQQPTGVLRWRRALGSRVSSRSGRDPVELVGHTTKEQTALAHHHKAVDVPP